MSCFSPLKAWPVPGQKTINGKQAYKILSLKPLREPGYPTLPMGPDIAFFEKHEKECISIPCGKCIGCRLSYARQWADRCMLELQYHQSAWFVTLTYNDEHVPRCMYGDPDTGEARPCLTLDRRDVQLFLKRLRKAIEPAKIRYFGCAEYGPQTWRPHYHMIIFGLPLDDLVLKRQDMDGKVSAYTSATLSKAWCHRPFGNYSDILEPLGDVECSEVTWAACNYVARYIVKKQLGPDGKDFYERFNLVPPFTFMSRDPGIGRQFFEDHPDLYDFDSISVSTPTGGRNIRPPRYYDKLYDIDHPQELAQIKESRRFIAEQSQQFKLFKTSLNVYDLQALEERLMEANSTMDYDI
ncbi:replication initiator protein [Peromfec virus RodF8_32]|uniref:Replication initiator protein n=1 Tax=Peromfec virus RodF8_32 TaxID=2929369 RepID=A0A976N1S8_9VIRU|nr:replication initiator protein [Peromfec virus RodF8_32]